MKKRNDEYLLKNIDRAINELVVPKYKLQKCYNYYNGKRDAEQFRYLEENFGIGNPTSIEFTPLIRKHIDALVGEYIGTPLLPKVSCKDKETLSKITRDKELAITQQVSLFLQDHLNNQILNFIQGKPIDDAIDEQLKNLTQNMNNSFISEYEIAAQNVIEYLIQARSVDLTNKLKNLLMDLLITGESFYRVKPTPDETNVQIEVLNPLNTFIDRNPESVYVNDGYRSVIRYWLTKQQILNKYGKDLSEEAIDEVDNLFEGEYDNTYTYVRSLQNCPTSGPITEGLKAGVEVTPGFPIDYYDTYSYKLVPVYEVEWIEVDRDGDNFIENRYEGVRIGQNIHVLKGKSEDVVRTKDAPYKCKLALNGLFFVNRTNEPYSLIAACSHLQDKYDLLTYFRDNVIANSGTMGDWLDLSMLPTAIGDDLTERIQKWIAYKKSGIALVDTSQEGRAFNNNTSFAGFDDTIKAQTIQAFDLALARLEETCSSITGVFRERLNGIEQRDAVTNVQTSVNNSYIITKQYYLQMDTLVVNMLQDSLNTAKKVWKKGLTGVLVLGDRYQKIFTALPEHFTFTDYDVHITASSQILQETQQVRALSLELIKSGLVQADVAINAATARSLTELKRRVQEGVAKAKEENQNLSKAQQQIQELQSQLQQAQSEMQKAQQKIEQLNEARIQLDQQRFEREYEVNMYKAKTERDFKQSSADNDTRRTDIEYQQQFDGNPYNDPIRRS